MYWKLPREAGRSPRRLTLRIIPIDNPNPKDNS